ncbi:hypothetical protein GCM10011492_03340 [Flexivirga endophytica]|uniref:Uncharacterized protein n=1 Tax=Flexivirga endophytica TaxID=1849103 RepID=A0A916STH2_9MICO|nr:hypothetical protein [Flexivirga endophytica]GGB16902.1 hypothetical protein GCM10011492_03340 [Flexivirga endophytica]GHB38645.1 hypothetical protein GCM10008112_04270 [Flexivirga endophytica]
MSVRLFYALNDYRFVASDDEKFDLIVDIATDALAGVAEIAARLERYAGPA